MRIKTFILSGILALSLLCACGADSDKSNNTTESAVLENSTSSGNFSDPIFIENPGTDTVIVEMP